MTEAGQKCYAYAETKLKVRERKILNLELYSHIHASTILLSFDHSTHAIALKHFFRRGNAFYSDKVYPRQKERKAIGLSGEAIWDSEAIIDEPSIAYSETGKLVIAVKPRPGASGECRSIRVKDAPVMTPGCL